MSIVENFIERGDKLLGKTLILNVSRIGYLLREPTWDASDNWVSMADKVCVITGANSGLGRVVSTRLAALGARVYLLCRNEERGEQARFEIINSTQDLDDPQFHRRPYIGPLACVESKRAKVELARLWSDWYQGSRVSIHAMHPGWADTPSAWGSVPRLATPIRPLVRTPEQGADTLLWLAVNPRVTEYESGQFWFDRRPRDTHRLGFGKSSEAGRKAFWQLCCDLTGYTPQTSSVH